MIVLMIVLMFLIGLWYIGSLHEKIRDLEDRIDHLEGNDKMKLVRLRDSYFNSTEVASMTPNRRGTAAFSVIVSLKNGEKIVVNFLSEHEYIYETDRFLDEVNKANRPQSHAK